MYYTDLKLKKGLHMEFNIIYDGYCGSGGQREWIIYNDKGHVVDRGITCSCGRGCSGMDCVRDDWGYHDTDIEQYRAD